MKADNIFQHSMEYAEGAKVWESSDADYYTLVSKMTLADKDLDFYTLGVLMRFYLLAYYGYDWKKIYEYGNEKFINTALDKLEETKYLKRENGNVILL